MNWQPIETAPRDGTVIWGIEPGEAIGWNIPRQAMMFWAESKLLVNGGFWRKFESDIAPVCFPTHWMPLPEPPND